MMLESMLANFLNKADLKRGRIVRSWWHGLYEIVQPVQHVGGPKALIMM